MQIFPGSHAVSIYANAVPPLLFISATVIDFRACLLSSNILPLPRAPLLLCRGRREDDICRVSVVRQLGRSRAVVAQEDHRVEAVASCLACKPHHRVGFRDFCKFWENTNAERGMKLLRDLRMRLCAFSYERSVEI